MKISQKDIASVIELHLDLNERRKRTRPKMTELTCRRYTLLCSSIMLAGVRTGLVITWEPKSKAAKA